MPWYTAHAIFLVQYDDGNQDDFAVLETVHLVRVPAGELVLKRATSAVLREYGGLDDRGGSVRCSEMTRSERPARWAFQGFRKIVWADELEDSLRIRSGTEISYAHLEVQSLEELHALTRGEEVSVDYLF